ncbi:MAG: T9SS type A sorting domain-containing protein [Flavobacteriales bacterium]|nr:T9SS type A sorting domain-containing protein [Flavobacteriales bacterium]
MTRIHYRSTALSLLLIAAAVSNGATYYVSPTGSDSNNGTSQATAWQSIARVNQISSSMQPGDKVLFQKGGTYRGKLTISSNGSASSYIEIGSYGSGAKPVISGSVAVTNWTQHNGNIWRAALTQRPKQVYVAGALMTIARFPNTGWLRVDAGNSTSLTDSELNQVNGYWSGATAVIRTTNWSYDTAFVSGFSNGILTHSSTGNNLSNYAWGYFLRNKLALLDAPGEWYYDPASSQLYIWCPASADPNNVLVEAAVLDNAIYVSYQRHHIRIDGVAMKHNTDASLRLAGSTNLEAMNCIMSDTWQAVRSTGSQQSIHHNTVLRTYGTAVYLMDDNTTFTDNTVDDIALEPGLGENNWGYFGFRATGNSMVIARNRFENIGYIGIVAERNALIEHNVVHAALTLLNDGGGIALDNADGMIVRNNIVSDLNGNIESSATNYYNAHPMCHGIYFGNISIKNTLVKRNTVANCLGSGIHVDHTMVSSGNRIEENTLFNNTIQLSISDYSNYNGPGATAPYHVAAFDDVYIGNILYCLSKDQLCMRQYHVYANNWVDYGTFSNNRYFNPYNDRSIFLHNTFSGTQKYYTLERWQTERSEDVGSTRSPLYLPDMEVTEVFGTNPVPNSTFNSNVTGWSGWPTQGQITHNTNQLDGGALKVNFTNNASYNTFGLKHDTQVPVQNGQWYRMRFSIKSDMMGEVVVGFKGQSQLSGPEMEGTRTIPFDGNRRDVTLFFQSSISDQGYCSFTNHYTESVYYLDNVELHRVSAVPIDPLDQQQLLVNDQGSTQTFDLVGCWSDVNGTLYSGSLDLAAFSSLVLVKEANNTCLSTDVTDGNVADASGSIAYPNPVADGRAITITGSSIAAGTVRLLDARGSEVFNARVSGNGSTVELPSSVGPGTYLLRIADGERVEQQRLVVL